jgi:hypothetical protein
VLLSKKHTLKYSKQFCFYTLWFFDFCRYFAQLNTRQQKSRYALTRRAIARLCQNIRGFWSIGATLSGCARYALADVAMA